LTGEVVEILMNLRRALMEDSGSTNSTGKRSSEQKNPDDPFPLPESFDLTVLKVNPPHPALE